MNFFEAFVATIAILMPVFIAMVVVWGRKGGRASPVEQQQLVTLSETARRMERRIESLEMLLDTESPGWRSRSRV
ncbi:MAG TPA: hypothetical protein VMB71_08995 [Acetobacteraceae bacterium]|nr:hypothetical protein [Acetobacteraceae bacterium]